MANVFRLCDLVHVEIDFLSKHATTRWRRSVLLLAVVVQRKIGAQLSQGHRIHESAIRHAAFRVDRASNRQGERQDQCEFHHSFALAPAARRCRSDHRPFPFFTQTILSPSKMHKSSHSPSAADFRRRWVSTATFIEQSARKLQMDRIFFAFSLDTSLIEH
jgi:hypothetical protein